jgi:hypothetical protein
MPPWYFTFLDGAFRYDCAACGQACCRGKGIAIDAGRELVPLVSRVPRLAPLVMPLSGGYVRLPDATDGCWFLRPDGMCAYEQNHGRESKFLTCRLFPFNRVFRSGAMRVVDFNSVVCPLQDAYGTGTGVSYRELEAEIKTGGDSSLVNSPVELPEGARELRWHALEQGILEASAAHLEAPDYITYAEFQSARSQRHLGEVLSSEQESGLFALVDGWVALYGIKTQEDAWRTLAQKTARHLSLLTPSLRFNTLFKRGVGAYRPQLLGLPKKLLATWFLATIGALAMAEGQAFAEAQARHVLSLRALTELYQAHAPVRDLLSRLDEPARLERPIAADDMPAELAAAVRLLSRNLLDSSAKASQKPLAALLLHAANAHGLSHSHRALLPGLLLRAGNSLHFPS